MNSKLSSVDIFLVYWMHAKCFRPSYAPPSFPPPPPPADDHSTLHRLHDYEMPATESIIGKEVIHYTVFMIVHHIKQGGQLSSF